MFAFLEDNFEMSPPQQSNICKLLKPRCFDSLVLTWANPGYDSFVISGVRHSHTTLIIKWRG